MASAILVGRSFIFDQKQNLLLIIIVIDNHMEVKTSKAGKGKDNPEELWQNSYSWPKCIWEMSYLTFSFVLWYFLIQETVKDHKGPLPVVLGFIAANFFVDWISGMLHWAADTWGHFKTPIFGPTIIRSFRMHHLDPQDITKHSFAQTNAATSYPAPFVITLAYYSSSGSFLSQTYNWMIIFSLILGILTNEIHKWSHMVHSKPHPVVRFFQQSGLIISHEVHHKHHTGKFDTEYCIINGWCNPFLQRIDYWRRLQRLITKLTGAIPRQDDEYWRNLKQVQQ